MRWGAREKGGPCGAIWKKGWNVRCVGATGWGESFSMRPPRRNQPALYELISARTKRPPVGPGSEAKAIGPEETGVEEERPALIGPGRVVRLPVGYFFFGAAVVLAAAFGGYLIGYQVRDRGAEAEKRRLVGEGLVSVTDPLAEDAGQVDRARPVERRESTRGESNPTERREEPRTGSGGGRVEPVREVVPGVLLVEAGQRAPWEPGLNYLVMASYGQENAIELAEFMAGNGVPVVVVRLPRANLWSVVSQQGFTRDPMRADGEIGTFRERVERLGREFGALGGWRKASFADMYGRRMLSP